MKKRVHFSSAPAHVQTPIQGKVASSPWQQVRELPRVTISLVLVGLAIGLFIGWVLWPVEWVDGRFQDLGPQEKAIMLDLASDLNAFDMASPQVTKLKNQWGELDAIACNLAETEPDQARRIQLLALAFRVNGEGCIDD